MAASRGALANQIRAQEALFQASIAQIKVASFHALIEAAILQAEAGGAGGRLKYADEIRSYAKEINALVLQSERSS